MRIYILQYEGLSWVSKLIKFITWGPYSHSAISKTSGLTMEAWEKKGVDLADTPWENHTVNTPVNIYRLDASDKQCKDIWESAKFYINENYDWQALFGFIPLLRWLWRDASNKWFCSHFVAQTCREGGVSLFSMSTPLYKISPNKIPWSVKLHWVGKANNINEYLDIIEAIEK